MARAIVTGGNSGIGRAAVVALATRGWDVGVTWHDDEERAQSVAREVGALGRRCELRRLDLHDVEDGAAAVDELAGALGGVDALVNNAGYGEDGPALELTPRHFRDNFAVNVIGAFCCAQAAARRMIDQGRGGRIVNVTSVHEHIPMSGSAPYVASKHALGGLTKVLALEWAEHDITVVSVAPGQIATRMTGQEDRRPQPGDVPALPLRRAGDANEVGGLIAFLAGDPAAGYVTGSSFVIDGGLSLIAAEHQDDE
jgi:NAD(P)-dependent dehydrogenase (short-subunit alcohol dehydrogenase family)